MTDKQEFGQDPVLDKIDNKTDVDKSLTFQLDKKRRLAGMEALLFASGDPLSVDDLCRVTGMTEPEVADVLGALEEKLLNDKDCGFMLRRMNRRYTLSTKPDLKDLLEQLYKPKNRPKLTQASYEVLAIVAYNQPVTRAQIETVRGVNSDSIISRLEERGFIYVSDTLDAPGRPSLFSTTEKFLLETGIESIGELPPLEMIMYSTLQEFEQQYGLSASTEA